MKIGVVGPADDPAAFRAAVLGLSRDQAVEQVVFLGDGAFLDRAMEGWGESVGRDTEAEFLRRSVEVAEAGTADDIRKLLEDDELLTQGHGVRKMPAPPARAIELVDDRIVLFVHDKSVLDEEDIANATVIVYGKSDEALIKRFGKRAFATPGPLAAGHVLVIEPGAEGIVLTLLGPSGEPKVREAIGATHGKLTVS